MQCPLAMTLDTAKRRMLVKRGRRAFWQLTFFPFVMDLPQSVLDPLGFHLFASFEPTTTQLAKRFSNDEKSRKGTVHERIKQALKKVYDKGPTIRRTCVYLNGDSLKKKRKKISKIYFVNILWISQINMRFFVFFFLNSVPIYFKRRFTHSRLITIITEFKVFKMKANPYEKERWGGNRKLHSSENIYNKNTWKKIHLRK